jgi:hypothetical protein
MENRDRIEARLRAFVADHLDGIEEANPEGFELGVVMILSEVRYAAAPEHIEWLVEHRGRPEAEYTPEAERRSYIAFGCTDNRQWVKRGVLTEALMLLDAPEADDSDDGEDDDDSG